MSYAGTTDSISVECNFCKARVTMASSEFTPEEWFGLEPENKIWILAESQGWRYAVDAELNLIDVCPDCEGNVDASTWSLGPQSGTGRE